MARKHKYKTKEVIAAIRKEKGFISAVASRLGCSTKTVYNYINDKPTVKAALDDVREQRHDYVESKLMQLIDSMNPTAIIFYLKTQAKDRGYNERQEITGADGSEFVLKIYGNDAAKDI